MKIYFETKFPETITTISSASSLSARLGLLRLGEVLSEMVFKHQLPPVVAQAFTMYVLMTDDKREKLAISQVFFEAYLQLFDSEVTQFLDCCKDGMDLETLAILQHSGTSPDIRDAPGIKRLNPSEKPDHYEDYYKNLCVGLFNILCKQPHDLQNTAMQRYPRHVQRPLQNHSETT